MTRLVVVESPTKARTIRSYLPKDFQVEASMGHVRDLPASASEIPSRLKKEDWARLGVNVEKDFEPIYVVSGKKKKVVSQLKDALKQADELYIATDEDREGESIGWHLIQVLQPEVPVRRMVFHEITREAIEQALESTRAIDENLVSAQETRRILDRLVGYKLSPLLWKKIAPKLSAGRVQSVAVRLLVLREKERIAFVPAGYWDLAAQMAHGGQGFEAKMTHLGDSENLVRLASGRDFDDETGRLKEGLQEGKDVLLLSEERARALAERLPGAPWHVAGVETRNRTRSPYAPFITSTLQQEASRKLSLSARRTMQVAQRLYENGHITYMRTDSTNLSQQAVTACRKAVEQRYGKEYLSDGPRQYRTKSKGAQEAHEAIRPSGTEMKTKKELGLRGIEAALYDLIWKRTMATQMADARLRFTSVYLDADAGENDAGDGETARFRASGKEVLFPGFFRAYVEGSDDPEAELEDRERSLPALAEGDRPTCRGVEANGHETQPPARFTEASLVKMLEQEGIGRPSTYASIIDTVQRRGYVKKNGKQLVPTFTAFATNNLLEKQFERLVDVGFTADMEQGLDDTAGGALASTPYLNRFYHGADGIDERVEDGLERIDAREVSSIAFPQWGAYVVRVGRYGPYVEGTLANGAASNGKASGGDEAGGENTATASLPEDLFPGDVTEEQLRALLEEANKGDEVLGIHPEADQPVLLKSGPYGPYMQLGDDEQEGKPKRVSLPPGAEPEDVDFDLGLQIINLPRVLGEHPESGEPIKAHIGRYGPYVQHKRTFASLKKSDDVLTVELARALELIAAKTSRNKPKRTLGEHPETGKTIELREGRYGPYVKHGRTNASLKDDQTIEKLTKEEALALLAEKSGKKGKKKRGGRKKTSKK